MTSSVSNPPPAPRIILCPGQGAQFVGMGKAWYEASPQARAVFDKADEYLGDRLGAKLTTLCFQGPVERLNQTDVSQPAIYVCTVAAVAGMLARWGAASPQEAGIHATAGLSLGEYTALQIAGCFTFEDGLNLVTVRGQAMQDAADAVAKTASGGPGSGMVALIGSDEAQARLVCERVLATSEGRGQPREVLVPANFNAPGQVVISGHTTACEQAVQVAGEMGLRATALPVAGAFHSPLMAPAADRLRTVLAGTTVHQPRCVVMSNVTGEAHAAPPGRAAGTAGLGGIDDAIRVKLVEQLTHPVRWADDCVALARLAQQWTPSSSNQTASWHEPAPGKTLAGLMRRIDKTLKVETHDEPALAQ